MNKKLILFTIFVVLGSLLAACSLPGQAASQPTAQPLPSLQPQGTAVEDNASASLLATISALQTRVAAAPAGAASTSAPKAVPTDAPAPPATAVPTQAPTATAIPVGVAAPKVADPTEVIPTAVLAPTALPQTSGGVPVVYITPIAPLSPYIYSPQPYPYPYYPQSYPNYGQHVPGGPLCNRPSHNSRAGKIFFKAQDVADLRAAPAIDGLILVPDTANIFALLRQQAQP